MNYIARLQADLAAAEATLSAKAEAIQEFRVHFAGDVHAWLACITVAGT